VCLCVCARAGVRARACVRMCVCVCVCVFYIDSINKRSCSSKSRCYVFEQDCQGVKCKAPWSVVGTGYCAM